MARGLGLRAPLCHLLHRLQAASPVNLLVPGIFMGRLASLRLLVKKAA
jgi:hypothetical protein